MNYFNTFETKFFKLFATVYFLSIDYVFFNRFKVSLKSTFSLFFWDLSNIELFFTFSNIDSQPWLMHFEIDNYLINRIICEFW